MLVVISALLFMLLACTDMLKAESDDLKAFASNSVPMREDGKFKIPEHVRHIRLDIGLSYSAPMSQYWLSHEGQDLLVFGFEPNPACVNSILHGATKRDQSHGDPLQTKFIGKQFFLIPCALGISSNSVIKFYVTKDCGCSSLYFPKRLGIERQINVPIFSLSDFFDLFPFDSHPVIDYIKIDAQGADLDIVKSAGHYLTERVIYVTLEAENGQYENTVNSKEDIDTYMQTVGFIRYRSAHTQDPTYLNLRYANYVKTNTIQIYQKG